VAVAHTPDVAPFQQQSISYFGNTCAIRQGELHCWGDNRFGQLGRGDYEQQNVPARVGDAVDWKSIELASGPGTFACGLRGSGELYCWGDNRSGALGTGDYESRSVPTRVGDASDWSMVAVQGGVVVTGGHACGIRKGELYCWGDNTFGQLGTPPDRSLQMVEWE
jgi:alpha-tubulin suppressor-like RCC1 family protein